MARRRSSDHIYAVITGGGTGGHIYPALQVGEMLESDGYTDILFMGSKKGQEKRVCDREGVEFMGFDSKPLRSLATVQGWASALRLLKATGKVKREMREKRPDVVFATGGFAAAPVMAAARSLRVPYVVHESNSIPGRTNRMFGPGAAAITCSFKTTLQVLPRAVRTGQPIRDQLRKAAELGVRDQDKERPLVFGIGGSQGSEFLNETLPMTLPELENPADILFSTGKSHFERVKMRLRTAKLGPNIEATPFLEVQQLAEAYLKADVVVGRSGGTLSELAMFGLPSVLIPLPSSADNHQLKNAEEFAAMGAAKILRQSTANPVKMAQAIDEWLSDRDARSKARAALVDWHIPDATERIFKIVMEAAGKSAEAS